VVEVGVAYEWMGVSYDMVMMLIRRRRGRRRGRRRTSDGFVGGILYVVWEGEPWVISVGTEMIIQWVYAVGGKITLGRGTISKKKN
jgi:hypothetical protein